MPEYVIRKEDNKIMSKNKHMFNSILVELSSACNMECEFCPHQYMNRERHHMDYDLFRKIIDEIAKNNLTGLITLNAIGEPLLYPRLLEAIKYCEQKSLRTSIVTNGLLLTTDLYQKMVDSGLNEIQISFHDLTADSFAYRHAKTRMEYPSFYQDVIKLIDYHIEHNISTRMIISLMFCKESWIESELWDLPAIKDSTKNATILMRPFIDEMKAIAARNNIKCYLSKRSFNFRLKLVEPYLYTTNRIMKNVCLALTPLNGQLFNTRRKLAGALGKKIGLVRKTRGSCPYINTPMILANGLFIPCCIDGLNEVAMGKVTKDNTLMSIINGNMYQSTMNGFKKKRIINQVCQECLGKLVYKDPQKNAIYFMRSINAYRIIARLKQYIRICLSRILIKPNNL